MKPDCISILFEDIQAKSSMDLLDRLFPSLEGGLFPKAIQVSDILGTEPRTTPLHLLTRSALTRLLEQHSNRNFPLVLEFEQELGSIVIYGAQKILAISVNVKPETFAIQQLLDWFAEGCAEWRPSFAQAVLQFSSDAISNAHFRYRSPIPDVGIVSWLHYFDWATIKSKGLQNLVDYPEILQRPIAGGVLFQLFANPFDLQTPAGEARVVAVNEFLLRQS